MPQRPIVPVSQLANEPTQTVPQCIPMSTSPSMYPFDSMAQIERMSSNISSKELLRIEGMIKNDPRLLNFQKERERLHHQSIERVKKWGNTVMGKRALRLETIKRREEEAEERRVAIDKQWDAILKREQAETLEKSRMQRLFQNPEVRELHSTLMIQNVVAERDMQLKFQKAKREKALQTQKEEARKLAEGIIAAEKKEESKMISKAETKDKIAAAQREQLNDHRSRAEIQKKEESELDKRLLKLAKAKYSAKENSKKPKHAQIKEFREAQEKLLEVKRKKMESIAAEDTYMDNQATKFNEIRRFIDQKRKQVAQEKLIERQKAIEILGKRQLSAKEKEEEKLRKFEAVFQSARNMDRENVNMREVEKLKKHIENARHSAERREEVYVKFRQDDAEYLEKWSRSKNNPPYQPKQGPSEEEKKRARGERSRAIQTDLRIQIADKERLKGQFESKEKEAETKMAEGWKRNDQDFQKYGLDVANEWIAAGKDPLPILKAVEKSRTKDKYERRRGEVPEPVDTFDRLGFL